MTSQGLSPAGILQIIGFNFPGKIFSEQEFSTLLSKGKDFDGLKILADNARNELEILQKSQDKQIRDVVDRYEAKILEANNANRSMTLDKAVLKEEVTKLRLDLGSSRESGSFTAKKLQEAELAVNKLNTDLQNITTLYNQLVSQYKDNLTVADKFKLSSAQEKSEQENYRATADALKNTNTNLSMELESTKNNLARSEVERGAALGKLDVCVSAAEKMKAEIETLKINLASKTQQLTELAQIKASADYESELLRSSKSSSDVVFQDLVREKANVETLYSKCKQEVEKLNQTVANMQQKLNEKTQVENINNIQLKDVQSQLTAAFAELSTVRQQYSKTKIGTDTTENTVVKLTKDLEEANLMVSKLKEEVSLTRVECKNAIMQQSDGYLTNNAFRIENDKLKTELERLKIENERVSQTADYSNSDLSKLKKELVIANSTINRFELNIQEYTMKIEKLQENLGDEKTRNSSLKSTIEEQTNTIATLHQSIDKIKSDLTLVTEKLSAFQLDHENLDSSFNKVTKELGVVKAENDQKKMELNSLSQAHVVTMAEIEDAKTKLLQYSAGFEKARLDATNLEKVVSSKDDEISKLRMQVETRNSAIGGASKELSDMSTQLEKAREDLNRSLENAVVMKKSVENLEKANSDLKTECVVAQQNVRELREYVSLAKDSLSQLMTENAALKEELKGKLPNEDLRKEYLKIRSLCEDLINKVNVLTADKAKIMERLTDEKTASSMAQQKLSECNNNNAQVAKMYENITSQYQTASKNLVAERKRSEGVELELSQERQRQEALRQAMESSKELANKTWEAAESCKKNVEMAKIEVGDLKRNSEAYKQEIADIANLYKDTKNKLDFAEKEINSARQEKEMLANQLGELKLNHEAQRLEFENEVGRREKSLSMCESTTSIVARTHKKEIENLKKDWEQDSIAYEAEIKKLAQKAKAMENSNLENQSSFFEACERNLAELEKMYKEEKLESAQMYSKVKNELESYTGIEGSLERMRGKVESIHGANSQRSKSATNLKADIKKLTKER